LRRHKPLRGHKVFTSLLPDEEPYKTIGGSMFEALRNGLAHRFRPDTISIGQRDDVQHRFRFAWQGGGHLRWQPGNPTWLLLELQVLCDRTLAVIDSYQEELRRDETARRNFKKKHDDDCLKHIPSDSPPARAWQTLSEQRTDP
jgi:hypothetical protein